MMHQSAFVLNYKLQDVGYETLVCGIADAKKGGILK